MEGSLDYGSTPHPREDFGDSSRSDATRDRKDKRKRQERQDYNAPAPTTILPVMGL